ncbi:MAG: hypothetical protein IJZ30_05375 [Alphaproteobacteria bacterium]|nr:hypothetical protein [Alphaproteobacteria bacterium]
MVNKSKIDKLKEAAQAVRDLNRNYWDMRRDNTVGGDDYFHCKANYEATSRGHIGEKVAERLGNAKENFDYYYNQAWKGLSKQEAHKDRIHDRTVNKTGRQREKSGLYKNSKEGCKSFRVRGINDKY